MNKKVFISMVVLVSCFLVAIYVLKGFFPQEFMMSIQNESFIKAGQFVDSHIWLRYICAGITSFITYWLYCCACSHRYYLKWYECLYILGTIVAIRGISLFDSKLATSIQFSSFLFLPALTKGHLKTSAIVAFFHGIFQCLSLSIRSLPIYLTSVNYITTLILGLESYFWLLLFYLIFNYCKKKEKHNERQQN